MIRAGLSASGSRFAAAVVPREIGVIVAPWTTWETSWAASASRQVSAAHNADITIAVAGSKPVSCDLELVTDRPPGVWRALLGDARIELVQLVANRAQENPGVSATRIWSVGEALKKVGAMISAPLVFVSSAEDGCVFLSSGKFKIVTYATQLHEREGKFVIAVLSEAD